MKYLIEHKLFLENILKRSDLNCNEPFKTPDHKTKSHAVLACDNEIKMSTGRNLIKNKKLLKIVNEMDRFLLKNKFLKTPNMNQVLEKPGVFKIVYIEKDNRPVSFILFVPQDKLIEYYTDPAYMARQRAAGWPIELIMIYTDSAYRNNGYSLRLINHLTDRYNKLLTWGAHYKNTSAIEFYHKIGAIADKSNLSNDYPYIDFYYPPSKVETEYLKDILKMGRTIKYKLKYKIENP